MVEVEVRPPSPYRLPRTSSDRTLVVQGGVATRLLHVDGSPVLARAWQPGPGRVRLRVEPVDPAAVARPAFAAGDPGLAGSKQLALALERMRLVLGVDLDLSDFHRRFRRDPLVGPVIRRLPSFRPQ